MTEANSEQIEALRLMKARNYVEAARLFEPLAAKGCSTALINLGSMYERGRLGHRNEAKAVQLWEKAANGGSASAKYRLGRLFLEKNNLPLARFWFLEGSKQGNTPSMYLAGRMLWRGEGGDPEPARGYELLVHAANAGHAFAQRDLLRLQIEKTQSLWSRVKLRARLFGLLLSFTPRVLRNPYSVDFH